MEAREIIISERWDWLMDCEIEPTNKGTGRQLLDENEDPKYLERFEHPHQGDMVEHSDISWL